MIRVTDVTGEEYTYDDGGENGTGGFKTEDIHNNLVVETEKLYAVFAEGKWIKAEQDNPEDAMLEAARAEPDSG